MNLLFASPTYGPTEPIFQKNHRVAIMRAANRGITWVGDVSPDRIGWAAARNKVVESVVGAPDVDIDGVFWVDSDIMLPPDAIHVLASHGLDFVSGLYFQRSAPYSPVFARLNENQQFSFAEKYPENTLAPCDGVGFGCVYTSVRMLKAVAEMRESQKFGAFGGDFGGRTYGEDYTFCMRARKAGFRPHIDTSVKCQHCIGLEFADELLFKRYSSRRGEKDASAVDNPKEEDSGDLHQDGFGGGGEVHQGALQHHHG